MGFDEAIKSGFANYTNFKGRAIRSQHNFWYLFGVLVSITTSMLDGLMGYTDLDDPSPLNSIASLLLFLPGVSVMIRRFHDINKSGWNYFWVFTIIGAIPVIYWLFFKEGDKGKNFYGTNILYAETNPEEDNINLEDLSKLEKLAELKDKGHITEEEFNDKKKDLL